MLVVPCTWQILEPDNTALSFWLINSGYQRFPFPGARKGYVSIYCMRVRWSSSSKRHRDASQLPGPRTESEQRQRVHRSNQAWSSSLEQTRISRKACVWRHLRRCRTQSDWRSSSSRCCLLHLVRKDVYSTAMTPTISVKKHRTLALTMTAVVCRPFVCSVCLSHLVLRKDPPSNDLRQDKK